MGNALRCFEGPEEDHAGYPYYRPTSGRPTHGLQAATDDQRASAPPPPTRQHVLAPHGVTAPTAGVASLDQYVLNFKPATAMAAAPDSGHLQGNSDVLLGNKLVLDTSTEDIDESSAKGLHDAESYARANAMLTQVQVLGTTRRFWRMSDEATRISRKLALILRSHHAVGKYLAAPLQVSNVWISSGSGSVKLRGVRFSGKRFSLKRVRDDYRDLFRVLQAIIRLSGGEIADLPPDYKAFLELLISDTLTMKDEFLIVNNPALLPMSNRTEVFLMLYDRTVTYLGRTKDGRAKRKRILSKLPYEHDWLHTAVANTQINQWVVNVQHKYKTTQLDQLRLNRNVRCHMRQYNDDDVEEILYCEWPMLLTDMVKMLHVEGELQDTDIQNKFG